MKTSALGVAIFIGLCAFQAGFSAEPAEQLRENSKPSGDNEVAQLRATIVRYFASQSSFQEGDLLVRSQVEELQGYLRRTRGPIEAASRLLLKRVVQDNSVISRFYYRLGGAGVMRRSAQELGGFRQLEGLCASKEGRLTLQQAIKENDHSLVLNYLAGTTRSERETSQTDSTGKSSQAPSFLDSRIYTVGDFVNAVAGGVK